MTLPPVPEVTRQRAAVVPGGATLGAALLLSGCASMSPPDVARLERRIRELQDQVYVLERSRQETEARLVRIEGGGAGAGERPSTGPGGAAGERGRRPAVEAVPPDTREDVPAPPDGARQPPALQERPSRGADSAWDRARAEYDGTRYSAAIPLFERFIERFPQDPRGPDARYYIGESHYARSNFPQAIVEYGKVVESHPASERAPEALYKIGLSYEELGFGQNALQHLERLERGYPGSAAAEAARPLLKRLRRRGGRR